MPTPKGYLYVDDSYERALQFYDSPDYQEAMLHRDRYAIVHRYCIMRGAE